ncbi:MAG TPA: hypothetical protein VJN18_22710 [Polyangiaceae bacterium]|nr:hypothetical protein [Polyangiaceae bacterium]
MQNVFMLGDAFRRGLLYLSESLSATDDRLAATKNFMTLSAAEVREWVGGVVAREYDSVEGVDRYYLIDITPQDLGVADDEELAERLVATRTAFPYHAQCLAGKRELCPAEIFEEETSLALRPLGPITRDTSYSGDETYVRVVEFDHVTNGRHLVVMPKDGSPGRVLAGLRGTTRPEEIFAEPLSKLQHELTERTFGIGREATPERTCSPANPPLALPREYCVPGMQRDQFVPLANELTRPNSKTEDSWRHYLTQAEAAAEKADELARQMIEIGLENDIRKEGASEEVAEACGSFPHDATATAGTAGGISASGDSAIQNCLNPSTIDIVFLSKDPLKPATTNSEITANNAALCQYYCDGTGPMPELPWCWKCTSNPVEEITHGGLGFTDPVELPDDALDPLADCLELTKTLSWDTAVNGVEFGKFSSYVRQPWVSEARLGAAIAELTLVEYPNRSWYLAIGPNKVVESSVDPMTGDCLPLVYPYEATSVHRFRVDPDDPTSMIAPPETGIAQVLFPNGSTQDCNAVARENAELAVFYLGAMAGGIPPYRIWAPVPARNFAIPYHPVLEYPDYSAPHPDYTLPHPATVYSASQFTLEGQGTPEALWRLLGIGYNGSIGFSLADKEWVPAVAPTSTPARFFSDRARALPQLPGSDWRATTYTAAALGAATDKYLALPTANSYIRFGSNLLGGEDPNAATNWTANNSRQFLAAWLEDIARDYNAHQADAWNSSLPEWTSQSTRDKVHQAAWQAVMYGERLGYGQILGLQRNICERAFVAPVFGKMLSNNQNDIYLNLKIADAEIQAGKVFPFTRALPRGLDSLPLVFKLGEAAGREGGPESRGFAPGDGVLNDGWAMAHDRLLPTQCAPSERLELFLRTELTTNKEALQTLLRSLVLSCAVDKSRHFGASPLQTPKELQSMEDLRYLENWLVIYSAAAKRAAGSLFLVSAPAQSVKNAAVGTVGIGAVSQGEQGKLFLEIEENFRNIGSGFQNMGALFQQLAGEIRVARLQIEAAQLDGQARELQLALQSIENNRQLALSAAAQSRAELGRTLDAMAGIAELAGGAAAMGGGMGGGMEGSGAGDSLMLSGAGRLIGAVESTLIDFAIDTDYDINQDFSAQVAANLEAQSDVNQAITNNGIAQVIGNLGIKVPGIFTGISDHLVAIKNNVSDAQQNIITMKQLQSKAAIALAKAAGADFVSINGQQVPLHVNTVYRRQFDVLRLRYERALESAKRAAYLARLSIEERIGVRLVDLRSPIGPLEAPSLWVDDVCTAQGVNYQELRTATPEQDPTGAAEVDKIAGFADQYIGDYVAKLREFVEFYNIENPFKESSDTALLSLRESLGDADGRCARESSNLLFFSHRLDTRPVSIDGEAVGAKATTSLGGWRMSGCTITTCPDVHAGFSLKDDEDEVLAPPSNPGGTSWLSSIAKAATFEATSSVIPPGLIYQSVQLRAGGTYVLSWWDQARTADGEPVAASAMPAAYPVRVYDSEWRVVSSESFNPAKGAWSERRSLFVLPFADGLYHVAFAAADADVVGANLAISNVQLEGGGSAAEPTAYAPNDASRTGLTGDCTVDDPAEFRTRFDYKCEAAGCYYELRDLIQIDTQLLQQGYSPLTGKIASGNYNYRLGNVSLNLVGTALVDCAQSGLPSCYSSGYVEYDLSHHAPNVPVEDYSGQTRCFDFAIGSIRGGKAMVTERVLSLPLSSVDQDLIGQPAFSKQELVGRPLSGAYRLRIRETPGLIWQNLEDIQLLVNYDYWSRVSRASDG